MSMKIPRFRDAGGDYEIVLSCTDCGWSVVKDRVTKNWKQCRVCGRKLETRRVDYRPRSFKSCGK